MGFRFQAWGGEGSSARVFLGEKAHQREYFWYKLTLARSAAAAAAIALPLSGVSVARGVLHDFAFVPCSSVIAFTRHMPATCPHGLQEGSVHSHAHPQKLKPSP